jgi:hypothetical protein
MPRHRVDKGQRHGDANPEQQVPPVFSPLHAGGHPARRPFPPHPYRFIAAALTELRKDALSDLLATLSDATPDATAWDEAIADRRRGY